jgi:protein-tyrosine phosphatase
MNILVVCTGNILRSVIAESLLRSELSDDIFIESAGYPCKRLGRKPLPAVREAMREIGLDVSNHRAQRVTEEMIYRSESILIMTRRQKTDLSTAFPNASTKMRLIRDFDPSAAHPDIKDGFHLTLDIARKIRDDLRTCVPGIKGCSKSKRIDLANDGDIVFEIAGKR